MLHFHSSNRLEILVHALAEVLATPLRDPFSKEIIVVQSKGMERWIALQLAERLGVWMNAQFPFPEAITWTLFRSILADVPEKTPFKREVMAWSCMGLLPQWLSHPAFSELQHYLQQDKTGLKRFQLALKIADILDNYVVFRPDWITAWESGKHNNNQADWQRLIWLALTEQYNSQQHRARLLNQFKAQFAPKAVHAELPERICIFGIPALPPYYLEVFAQLGSYRDVHLFVINPCQEYWGDIVSDSEMARQLSRAKPQPTTPEHLHLERGNALLASMGHMGRDFIDLMENYPDKLENPIFVDYPQDSLLHYLQSDILNLYDRTAEQAIALDRDDKSLQIHACHSPMREIEVLHDQLLALFDKHSDLTPKDILVMMPDIEKYAPFIEAVFATTPEVNNRLPFSIADRSLRGESLLVDAFLAILELHQARFSVAQVLTVLEAKPVQQRFGLREVDLELVRHWLEKTEIRWGIDGQNRQQLDLPAYEENTWRAGLKRLLLGYALPLHNNQLFQGILPYDKIEGAETLILGKLVDFTEQLFATIKQLNATRTLAEWADFLQNLLLQFLATDDDNELEAHQIRSVINSLSHDSELADFTETVGSEVITAYLRLHLEKEPHPAHFITGNITFCAMLPMRSIPFRVICLLGMDDQAFPRTDKPLNFDFMAKQPRRGDRSIRKNDRYLFLETLLSARDYFYLSYVGQSIHDNTLMPPSVLVSELQDVISQGFTYAEQDEVLAQLITYHPLQAFSPRYFQPQPPELFSYSHAYCAASAALLNPSQPTELFFSEPLPSPDEEWREVDLATLINFFKNPVKFLLQQRLDIRLDAAEKPLDETEPFAVPGLVRYNLQQILLEKGLAGHDLTQYYLIAKAQGQLPHGQIGNTMYQQYQEQLNPFIETVQAELQQPRLKTVPIDLTLGEFRLRGRLNQVWQQALIAYRYAPIKAKDQISAWLQHLALNAIKDKHLPRRSVLIGQDVRYEYLPVADSEERLYALLRLYWQGLQLPLHFFPETSKAYVQQWRTQQSSAQALYEARKAWEVDEFSGRGESEDAYYQLCFAHLLSEQILNAEFVEQSLAFYQDLLSEQVVL